MDARSDSAGALAGPGRGGSVINLTLFQVVRTIRSTARVRVLAGARASAAQADSEPRPRSRSRVTVAAVTVTVTSESDDHHRVIRRVTVTGKRELGKVKVTSDSDMQGPGSLAA
eukprot:653537-Rhodomonas_salina.4